MVTTTYDTPHVLYSLHVSQLSLHLGSGTSIDFTDILSNGRSNYILFQRLTAICAGMTPGSEGGDSDLISRHGQHVEVKAYTDHQAYPHNTVANTRIHTAASSTFGPNNKGPIIKNLLTQGRYQDALTICQQSGFDKNDFYVYTNTRNYTPTVPFRYLILPTTTVLTILSKEDPRTIHRSDLLAQVTRTQHIML